MGKSLIYSWLSTEPPNEPKISAIIESKRNNIAPLVSFIQQKHEQPERRNLLGRKASFAPRATQVQVTSEHLLVWLADGHQIQVPLAQFPRLQTGTPVQRNQWRLIGGGTGIHWEALDEDVSIARLLGWPYD